jgi:hypothetical protein
VPSQPVIIQFSCYGQAESRHRCVGGVYGTADVGIAGLTIPQQLIGAPFKVSTRFEVYDLINLPLTIHPSRHSHHRGSR